MASSLGNRQTQPLNTEQITQFLPQLNTLRDFLQKLESIGQEKIIAELTEALSQVVIPDNVTDEIKKRYFNEEDQQAQIQHYKLSQAAKETCETFGLY